MSKELELVCGLSTHHPCLVINPRLDVKGLGVKPHVGDAEHRLGPQCGRWVHRVSPFELDDGELLDLGLLVADGVVLAYWVAAVGTPANGVAPLGDVAPLPELGELPLYELVVVWVDGRELPPPVDAEAHPLHPCLDLLGEIRRHTDRGLKLVQVLLWDVIDVEEGVDEVRVLLLKPLDHGDDRRPREVPSHREEDVVAPHPPVPGVYVGQGVGPAVADVLRRVGVRVGDGQVVLRPLRVGIGLEGPRVRPPLLPLLLELLPVQYAIYPWLYSVMSRWTRQ